MSASLHDWSRIAGLYAIVDLDACRGRDPLWLASEILAGGCAADHFIYVDNQGLNILAIDAVEANKPALILDVRSAAERECTLLVTGEMKPASR
mgnify:CR=1 FL=1